MDPAPRTAAASIAAADQAGRLDVLVQGLDLHVPAAAEMLRRFRFVPARAAGRPDDLLGQ
jgi:ribosomal protein L16 Arg81 hydroxylase